MIMQQTYWILKLFLEANILMDCTTRPRKGPTYIVNRISECSVFFFFFILLNDQLKAARIRVDNIEKCTLKVI